MPRRRQNSTVASALMAAKSFILYSFIATYANAFGRTSHSSSRIIDRTSRGKPPPLYYIDHDPMIEQSIKLQPVTGIATLDPMHKKQPKKQARSNKSRSTPLRPKSKYNKGLQDKTWNEQYTALLKFKQQYGHCQVPQNYAPSPKLGQWVMAQRRYYKLNTSLTERSAQRLQLLKEVGFVFKVSKRGPRLISLNGRDKRGNTTSIRDMDDFVGYMVENEDAISEKEKVDAWRERFSVYQK